MTRCQMQLLMALQQLKHLLFMVNMTAIFLSHFELRPIDNKIALLLNNKRRTPLLIITHQPTHHPQIHEPTAMEDRQIRTTRDISQRHLTCNDRRAPQTI